VPTFDEVLEFARGKIGVYIDAKRISAKDLVEAVRRHGMEDRVVLYGSVALQRGVHELEPRIKMMPEAGNVEAATKIAQELRPPLFAFDAHDFTDAVIAIVKGAGAGIYVDRLGPADNAESWEDAVKRGATGIQSDHPAELVQFLRSKGLHK
jgi:glycerophosphoryl diester phosphodiesterase